MKDYSVNIDVYDQYIIIHDYSNTPNSPRDIKLTCDGTDSELVTSLTHTLVNTGKETDLTNGGYLYTGLSSVDGKDYIYTVYLYSCDKGYSFASWGETSGYVMLCGYAYSKDAEGNKLDGYNWGHYYVYWDGELADPEKLYSAQGEFISQENSASGFLYEGQKADIEVYDDNSIIVRNFAGVEGHDLKVNYDNNMYVTGLSTIVDGVQGEVATAAGNDWFTFEPGNGQTHYIWGWNGYSWACSRENQSGYVYLYVNSDNANGDYIYISWPAAETPDAINAITTNNLSNAAIYNLSGQKVSANYRGIVVKNGKKFMHNVK